MRSPPSVRLLFSPVPRRAALHAGHRHQPRPGPQPVAGPRQLLPQLHQQAVERRQVCAVQPGQGERGAQTKTMKYSKVAQYSWIGCEWLFQFGSLGASLRVPAGAEPLSENLAKASASCRQWTDVFTHRTLAHMLLPPLLPIVRLTMPSGSGWLQQTSPRQPPPPAWRSRNAGWWARCTAPWPISRQRTSGEGGAPSAGARSCHAAAGCCRAAVDLPAAVSSCRRLLPSCPVCSHPPALSLTCSSVGLTLARPADCCMTLCGATLQTGEREA